MKITNFWGYFIWFGEISFILYFFTGRHIDGLWYDLLHPLSMQLISGVLLVIVVFVITNQLQKNWATEEIKGKSKEQFALLKKEIERTFERSMPEWNFSNQTPTFYFDNSWINPVYELLTNNNRRWEMEIIRYKKSVNESEPLAKILLSFIDNVETGLRLAEKTDAHLTQRYKAPDLAAAKDSDNSVDGVAIEKIENFKYLIYRSQVLDIEKDKILFRLALVQTGITTKFSKRVEEGIKDYEEKIEKVDKELSSLKTELKGLIINLNVDLNKIKDLCKSINS